MSNRFSASSSGYVAARHGPDRAIATIRLVRYFMMDCRFRAAMRQILEDFWREKDLEIDQLITGLREGEENKPASSPKNKTSANPSETPPDEAT